MNYENEKIGRLRDINESELDLMLSWRNEPAVRQNMYTRHIIPLDEHMRWWERARESHACEYFMYEFEGLAQGIVGFSQIDRENENASWAFYAAPEAPRGTGSRMEVLALDYAFGALNLHKLCCEVLAFNAGVIRLHQKFGFHVEGILREQHKANGEFVDIYCLGLLATDWSAKRKLMVDRILKKLGASDE